MLIGVALILLALIVYIVLVFLGMIQWVIYADTGRLSQGVNFLKSIKLIISHPADAAITIILLLVMYIITMIIVFVLEMLICTIIAIPFVSIVFGIAIYYILTRFYQKATGNENIALPSSGKGPGRSEESDPPHML